MSIVKNRFQKTNENEKTELFEKLRNTIKSYVNDCIRIGLKSVKVAHKVLKDHTT